MNTFSHLMAISPAHLVLAALVIFAAVVDWRTHRLPNWLTMGGCAAGLLLSMLPSGIGPLDSFLGLLTAFTVLLPLYIAHVTGAGDVKLMAAVGAFLGLPNVLVALALIMASGGIFALAFALWQRRLLHLAANTRDITAMAAFAALHGHRPALSGIASIGKLPYAVCVCAGTLAWLAWAYLRS